MVSVSLVQTTPEITSTFRPTSVREEKVSYVQLRDLNQDNHSQLQAATTIDGWQWMSTKSSILKVLVTL